MHVWLSRIALLTLVLLLPTSVSAQWSDDFDSYAAGSGIIGQGGWEGWEGDPAPDALVSDAFARSGENSLESGPASDVVQELSGVDDGMWIVTAWQYIPSGAGGETYFILLNSYAPDGSTDSENWSTQIRFGGGIVESEFDDVSLPLVFDKWVEIRVEVDFATDTQEIYYDDTLLLSKSWTEGVTGGGALELAAIDVFGNGADPVYYDDMNVERAGSTPTQVGSWGELKDRFRD